MTTATKQTGIIAAAAEAKAVERTEEKQPKSIRSLVKEMETQIAKALPKTITPERFTRIALTALSTTPALNNCTQQSFLGALMSAAQLGLEPNTPLGQAYLIPYYNNKKKTYECQFQIGYKGLLDLAYRSGEVTTIQAHTVYKNDKFEYELGMNPVLKHIPAMTDRGEPIYFYAIFKLKNGGESFTVCSLEDVKAHAKRYSKSYESGPWQTNFEEMAKKTVLKKLLKYAPIRSDFITEATAHDENVNLYSEAENEVIIDLDESKIDKETGEIQDGESDVQSRG